MEVPGDDPVSRRESPAPPGDDNRSFLAAPIGAPTIRLARENGVEKMQCREDAMREGTSA
jgi:hypothetical protein